MKRILSILFISFAALTAKAQPQAAETNEHLANLRIESRFDFMGNWAEGKGIPSSSGFRGRYVNLFLDGTINEHFSYSYRQRLNKNDSNSYFFDATDWLYLTYKLGDFEFSGGKQVVGIGGFEYDRAPIDLYVCSEYWNHIACYQLGVSAAWNFNQQRDKLLLQLCHSPFGGMADNTYAYNLMWFGKHGWFNSIYSVNAMAYEPGRYIYYLTLGNNFTWRKLSLNLDLMLRNDLQHSVTDDLSVMAELAYRPTDRINAFAKYTYDRNTPMYYPRSGNDNAIHGDRCVVPGSNINVFSAGMEYYPIKDNRNVRFHLFGAYCDAITHQPSLSYWANGQLWIDLGIKWNINLLKIR